MLLNNSQFKSILLLILVSICYKTYGLNTINIDFDFDYQINFNKKQIFNFTNVSDQPILIKVHQNYDINLQIYDQKGLNTIDTPGHNVVSEFLLIKTGKSIKFSIVPLYKNQNQLIVNFEKHFLSDNEFKIWSGLYVGEKEYSGGNVKLAAELFKKEGNKLKKFNNNLMFIAFFMSAVSYYDAQLYDNATKLFAKIINSNNESASFLKAITINYKARILSLKGFKLEAIELFLQSSKLFQKNNDISGFASSLNNIGLSYHLLGKLKLAEKYYNKALLNYKKINDTKAVANQYINIGGLYFMKGMDSKAEDYYNKAIDYSKKINDITIEADALEMFAWLQQSQGNYAGLLLKWSDILKIRKELNDNSGITRAYRLIGQSYLSYGNYKKALQFLKKSLELAKQVTLTENYPILLNNIAQAYLNLNQLDISHKFYLKALEYNLSVKNDLYAANDYLGISKINIKRAQTLDKHKKDLFTKDIQDAHQAIDQSISIYENSENKLNLVNALLVKAQLYNEQKEINLALHLLVEARKLSLQFNERSAITSIDILKGEILLEQQKTHDAIKLFKKVLIDAEEQRNQIINPKYRANFAANLNKCRNLLIQTLISQSIADDNENYKNEALIISELGKARSLNDLITSTNNQHTKRYNSKQKQLQEKLQTLYFLRTDLESKPHIQNSQLKHINQNIQQVLFNLDATYERKKVEYNSTKLDNSRIIQLQNGLSKNEMIVAFRFINDISYAWHITNSQISIIKLPPKHQIENHIELIYDYFKHAPYGIKRFPTKIKIANNWIVNNVFKGVDFNNINKIIISPHGRMQLFPIASLMKNDTKLITQIDMDFTPSLMIKKSKKSNTKFKKLLVVADPVTRKESVSRYRGSKLSKLKYSINEAKYIAELYGKDNVKLLLGENSNKVNVLNELSSQYDLIHFATHGLIDQEVPEMSGLILSSNKNNENDVLTIDEIINLNIQSNIVVLSACETAIGENIREEGLIGLSYAFLAAGANQVYATLWKIGDRSALKSIKKMYKVDQNNGVSLTIKDPFWVKFVIL